MMAEYDARNPQALRRPIANGVKLHRYPTDLLRAAQKAAFEFYDEEAAKNPAFKKIYTAWAKAREDSLAWFSVAEQGYDAFAYSNRG